ncbi:hypothetical protein EON65_53480 [archaeon]|nr:MAG: hypothetical protein EON65_53480 [archaeon]
MNISDLDLPVGNSQQDTDEFFITPSCSVSPQWREKRPNNLSIPLPVLPHYEVSIAQPQNPAEQSFLPVIDLYPPTPRRTLIRTRSRSPTDFMLGNQSPKILLKVKYGQPTNSPAEEAVALSICAGNNTLK